MTGWSQHELLVKIDVQRRQLEQAAATIKLQRGLELQYSSEKETLEEELGRSLRKIESLRLEVDHLAQEVDYHVEENQELHSQRQACADSAERWEARARQAERELEDMRRRVVGY